MSRIRPMAVQERPADRADQEPRRDAREGHEAGDRRRAVAGQAEQDERHADHRLRDPHDLHPGERAAEPGHGKQGAIGRGLGGHGHRMLPGAVARRGLATRGTAPAGTEVRLGATSTDPYVPVINEPHPTGHHWMGPRGGR